MSPGREWWWTGDAWVAAADHPDGRAALGLDAAPVPVAVPVAVPVPVPVPVPAPESYVAPADPVVGARIEVPLTLLTDPEPAVAAAPVVVPPAVPAPVPAPVPAAVPAVAPPATEPWRHLRLAFTAALAVAVSAGAWLLLHDGTRSAAASESSTVDRREFAVRAAVDAQESYRAAHGTYAGTGGLRAAGFYGVATVTTTVLHADRSRFCLQVSSQAGAQWYDSRTQSLGTARCR